VIDSELTRSLTQRAADPEAFRCYMRLARVEAWLHDNYAGPVSLATAAGVAGFSTKYFSKYFRDRTGVRFSEWVRSVRIRKAMQRMRAGDCSVATVAVDAGFGDLRTFERVFKKQTGLTPRAYRDRVRPDAMPAARIVRGSALQGDHG